MKRNEKNVSFNEYSVMKESSDGTPITTGETKPRMEGKQGENVADASYKKEEQKKKRIAYYHRERDIF